ncbi:hypothetical protein GF406_13620 [candidate division KSB1 bacterium]|nr:hypothetical protein [candidate division KSB1 bacterium]
MTKTNLSAMLLIVSLVSAAAKDFPPPGLTGTWTGQVEIFGPFKVEPYPSQAPEDHPQVIITIHSDGTVQGRIGAAKFVDAFVRKNRGWFFRLLNIKTDYIITGGTLEGKVTPRDTGTKAEFLIPFSIVDDKLQGSINLLPKTPLTRQLNLVKK